MLETFKGKIYLAANKGGLGILSYENGTKYILYYRAPSESLFTHKKDDSIVFCIKNVSIEVSDINSLTVEKKEGVAILVKEQIDKDGEKSFQSGIDLISDVDASITSVVRSNSKGGEDPPKKGVTPGTEFLYRYGKLKVVNPNRTTTSYYFDRRDYPLITETSNTPFYATKTVRAIDVNQMLNGLPQTLTPVLFAIDITTS